MVFSSIEFLLGFLPVFLILYWMTPKKLKNVVLLSGSLIFYAMGEPGSLVLLMVSVMVNYFFGLHLGQGARNGNESIQSGTEKSLREKELRQRDERRKSKYNKKRKILLVTALTCNLGVLLFFKGGTALPAGISFYTFQIIAYLIDVYKGEEQRENSFLCLATYVTMFPQLMSGPILIYGEARRELHKREFTAAGIQEGLKVFTMGLALKVLLADRIGILWREVQVTGFESISTPLAWIAAIAYSLKLYFDFYGYSLMAIGLGKILGFELPKNFDNPYMAYGVRDFYRKWHITLGRWFCRYVYIPLGGNRRGEMKTVCNLLVVWLLTAIWHGSTANFLIWGMLLWLFIVLERQLEALGFFRLFRWKIFRAIPHLYVWFVIPITWMCFAITDVADLQIYLGRMFGTVEGIRVSTGDWIKAVGNYWYLFLVGFWACTPALQKAYERLKNRLPGIVLLVALFWLCVWRLQVEGQNPFMYFDF